METPNSLAFSMGTFSCAVREIIQPPQPPSETPPPIGNNTDQSNIIANVPQSIMRWYSHMIPVAERSAPECDGTVLTLSDVDDTSFNVSLTALPGSAKHEQATQGLTRAQVERRRQRGKERWQDYLSEDFGSSSSSLPSQGSLPLTTPEGAAATPPPSPYASSSKTIRAQVKRITVGLTMLLFLPAGILGLAFFASSSAEASTRGDTVAPPPPPPLPPPSSNSHEWKPVSDGNTVGRTPALWIFCDEATWQANRQSYPNELWVESCHPGDSQSAVHVVDDYDQDESTVVLEARVNQTRHVRWIPSSEEQQGFGYGTYTWHVESISKQGLPPSMVLRFFLHDPLQEEAHHMEIALAIDNHEMPNVYFAWSPLGVQERAGSYVTEDFVLSLDWHPGWLVWTAQIGSQVFTSRVDSSSLDEDDPLVLPCLPRGPLEAHMLLTGVSYSSLDSVDDPIVQVKLASFSYEAAQALVEGGVCTRDCDCQGEENVCLNRRCTVV